MRLWFVCGGESAPIRSGSLLVFTSLALLGSVHCSAPVEAENDVPAFSGPYSPGVPGASVAPGSSGSAPGMPTPGTPPSGAAPSGAGEGNPTPTLNGTNNPGSTPGAAPGTSAPPMGTSPSGAPPAGMPPAAVPPAAVPPAAVPPAAVPPAMGPARPQPPPAAFVQRGNWRGFAFTEAIVNGTSIAPADFSQRQANQPFCANGSVAAEPAFQGEAMIGFNLNQAQTSDVPGQAAPVLTAVPTGTGVAFTFSKSVGGTLRVQLQPPGDVDPYCYEVPEASGRAFAPYALFNTACWDGSGQAYNRQPIESLKFQVPGDDTAATPFGFCIGGFADAQGAGEAPADIPVAITPIAGSISGQLDRVKVQGGNGESYIVQNNAWGDTSFDGSQIIDYRSNGFTIRQQSAPPNGNVPVSFPSIFVGGNGFRGANNSLTTRLDDRMPIRVGSIQSAQTRLRHNGSGNNGNYNVTYDVWFANQSLTGDYETAQAAFLMVWLYKPGNRNAIGFQNGGQTVTVDNRTWRLYVGNRNEASDGTGGNAPVISYVNEGAAILDYQFDLNVFIRDAVTRSQNNQLNGAAFNANLFLTDIFGGFEIWSGGQGLRIDEFSAVVR